MIGRLLTRKSGERGIEWTSLQMGTNCEDVCVSCECLKSSCCREEADHQVDKII